MKLRRFPRAMDFFFVIPHGAGNVWTQFQFSGNFLWVFTDFELILPVYQEFFLSKFEYKVLIEIC